MFVILNHMILILLISIIISMINFDAYLKGYQPNLYQLLASVLFILLWFLYGLFMSYKGYKYFIKLSTLYWGIGALLSCAGYFVEALSSLSILAVCLFAGPVYGIRYFLDISSGIGLVLSSIAITYGLSLIGYWIGKGLKKDQIRQ